MSARFWASIRFGGELRPGSVGSLLAAIAPAHVNLDGDGAPFAPANPDELLTARRDACLWLCARQAEHGSFPDLEKTCRLWGLGYTRFAGASEGRDVELVDWRPSMREPLVRVGSSADWDRVLVDVAIIQQALSLLYAGQVQQAIHILAQTCPSVSPLPPFTIV